MDCSARYKRASAYESPLTRVFVYRKEIIVVVANAITVSIGRPSLLFLYDRQMQFLELLLVHFAGAIMRGFARESPLAERNGL